jgi:hypothetical protein
MDAYGRGGSSVKQALPIPDYAFGIRLMLEALQKKALRSLDKNWMRGV